MTDRPNVLFLVADSLRADVIFGDWDVATPTIDAMADDGTAFTTCFSQGISTAPAMTAMLTGRLPLDYGGHWYVHDDQPTMAEQFRENGYATAAIHSNPNVSRFRNFDKGFDTFDENVLPVSSEGLFESFPDDLLRYLNKFARILSRTPYLPADDVNEQMTDWIDGTDEPWFLWTQYMDTHGPYLPGDEFTYRNKIRAERLWRKAAVDAPEDVTDDEHAELRRNYGREVAHFDAALGRFFDTLAERGHLDETIVILVGDHGDEFAEHGQYGHGNLPYEELVHVPLLVRWPEGFDSGFPDRVETPVRCLDILPTVLDLVAADLTDEMRERMTGKSLRENWTDAPDVIVTEKQIRGGDALRFGFRADGWTYLYDGRDDTERLYDRTADPEERIDCIDENPAIVEQFRERLRERIETIESTSTDVETPEITDAPGVQERLRALGYRE